MSEVNLSISNTVIDSIVKEKIKASVASALADKGDILVQELVKNILYTKVDLEGRPTSSTYNTMPLLDYMLTKALKESAEIAIKEWIQGSQDKIKLSIKKSLEKNSNKFAATLTAKLIEDTNTSFKYKLEVLSNEASSIYDRVRILEEKLKD